MKFSVPQFIDVEDKIIWILTLKQFLWLLAGTGIILALLFLGNLQLWALILSILPIAAFFIGMAFIKVDDRPIINYLVVFFKYLIKPKLFLRKKDNIN